MFPRDCCVALRCGIMGVSAVCDCGISWFNSLMIIVCFSFHKQRSTNSERSTKIE